MNNGHSHIIDKMFVEVNTSNEKAAHQIKDDISTFLNAEVFPKLEELFTRYDFNNQIFRFDRLDISFCVKDWNRPEEIEFELVKNLAQKIEEALPKDTTDFILEDYKIRDNEEPNKSIKQFVSKQQNSYNTFVFFLENGFLPWFGKQEYIEELTAQNQWQKSLKQTQFLSELKELFQENKTAIERFILQSSDEQVISFVESLERIQIKDKAKLLNFIQGLAFDHRNSYLKLLINIALNKTEYRIEFVEFVQLQIHEKDIREITEQLVADWNLDFLSGVQHCFAAETNSKYFQLSQDEIRQIVKEIEIVLTGTHLVIGLEEAVKTNLENKPTINLQEFVSTEREKEPPFFEKDINEIVVRNAGLVLFHPFLNTFFSHFGWINKKGRIKDEFSIKAVQALHYCATGSESFFEGNLLLEKFLCNIPLATPLPIESILDEQVKIEAKAMLEQLIKHWPALKNTSPDGLREMFIHRDGKLIQKEKGYKLIVERKVQDILLDRLQWGISIVKLPWKDDLLFVEW